jgi:hypothetical protein
MAAATLTTARNHAYSYFRATVSVSLMVVFDFLRKSCFQSHLFSRYKPGCPIKRKSRRIAPRGFLLGLYPHG